MRRIEILGIPALFQRRGQIESEQEVWIGGVAFGTRSRFSHSE